MNKRIALLIAIVGFLAWCGSVNAQEAANAQEVEDEIQVPSKGTAEYWVVRSRGVSELRGFLTRKRVDLKENLSIFVAFLDKLGKADHFSTTPVEVPSDPKYRFEVLGILEEDLADRNMKMPTKPMSLEHMVEIAMEIVVSDGYLSVHFSDGEELKNFKDVLKRRESSLRKVQSDVNAQVEACLRAWFYLGSINHQDGFKLFRFNLKEEEKRAKEEQRAAASAARGSRSRGNRGARKQAELQRRQDRLDDRYQNAYWGR